MKNNKRGIIPMIVLLAIIVISTLAIHNYSNSLDTNVTESTVSTTESTTAITFPAATTTTSAPTVPTTTTPTTTAPSIVTTSPSTTIYVTTTLPAIDTPATLPEAETTMNYQDNPTTQSPADSNNENIINPDEFITVNNSEIMFEENTKVMCLTIGESTSATKVKDVHNTVFEETKTNIREYCTINDITTFFKKSDTVQGSDAYYLFGTAETDQFGKSYIISATMMNENKPYNFTIIYAASIPITDMLESITADLDVFMETMM